MTAIALSRCVRQKVQKRLHGRRQFSTLPIARPCQADDVTFEIVIFKRHLGQLQCAHIVPAISEHSAIPSSPGQCCKKLFCFVVQQDTSNNGVLWESSS